jgi:RHS repeat-associated protein
MKQKRAASSLLVRGPWKLARALGLLAGLGSLASSGVLRGADKNGVSPQAISLPTGPGSIQGLGESFQPQLNTGSGSYAVKLEVPPGSGGQTPELTLGYDTGSPNGPLGLGWTLSTMKGVARNTDDGVPLYVDGPNGLDDDLDGVTDNPHELDHFTGMDGEELVQLGDGSFRSENEASFLRYQRAGAGWEARSKDGTLYEFGKTPDSQIEEGGRVFKWLLERVVDLDQNTIEYRYLSHPESPGQLYCQSIRWGQPQAFFAAVFAYETGRPDVFTDFRSGFEVRTALRLVRLDVVSQGVPAAPDSLTGDLYQDGIQDRLIRRYQLAYHQDAHLSLLSRVTKLGRDGLTAFPPATFDYRRWTPPTNVAGTLITDGGVAPPGLNADSVELIDMNGDGLPDFLSTIASQHRVQLNQGQNGQKLIFGGSLVVGNAPPIDIASSNTHLADSSADGAADLMVRAAADRFLCFDNTSHNAWASQGVPMRNTDTWPLWPFDGTEGMNSRSLDTDHNRANDVLHTGPGGLQIWMLSREGQYASEVRTAPLICEGKTFRFDLPGTHVADINSDRLPDIAWVQPTRVVYWPSQGRGRFGEVVIMNLGVSLTTADIQKAGFSDVDGDGLVDLTVVRPSSLPQGVLYWLNRFQSGLVGPSQVTGLPALNASDALRWADMNGNGSSDILISNGTRPAGQRLMVIDLVPGIRPYLLERVENGLGLRIDMAYESSVDQMLRAQTPWAFTMPMPVPVLAQIAEDDGRGNVNTRAITYRDPYYDAEKQEFRGFRQAELRDLGDDSVETQATIHRFDTGETSDCLKGKLLETVVTDEVGNVVERSQNFWSNRLLATGIDDREICYAVTEQVDRTILERGDAPVLLRSEMRIDDFGNEFENRNHGVLAVPGDEVFTFRTFELRPAVWLMGLKTRETVKDAAGNVASDAFFTYDARGHVTRHEAWLDTENRNVVVARNAYDAFGNLVEVIDANGHRRTREYDPLVRANAVAERVHLEGSVLAMTAEYDLGLGVVIRGADFSGVERVAEYDALGRIVSLTYPGGARKTFEYRLGNPVSTIVERYLETSQGATRDSFAFSDGHGRKLGSKVEAEGGKWRFLDAVRYNRRKLAAKTWLSHETAGPEYEEPADSEAHETQRYDVMARLIEVVHPDGSATRTEFEPLAVHHFDENDTAGRLTPRTVRRDGLGRVVEVLERNGAESYRTSYRWNTLGDLLEVRDARDNVKTMAYDSLHRRTAMHDPNRGDSLYTYDDANNVLTTQDAKGQVIAYEYDFANRIVHETRQGAAPGAVEETSYFHDAPSADLDLGDGERATATLTTGRLAAVIDPSGETHFSYDQRGNQAWIVKRIREPHSGLLVSYTTRFAYDLQDRLAEVVYPDGDRVRYAYNQGNFVERIDGGPQGAIVASNFDYHPSGEFSRAVFGNDVETTCGRDRRHRLISLVVASPGGERLIDNEYRFDPASNLSHILDRRPFAAVDRGSPRRNTQLFTYDGLDRLTRVRYSHFDDLNANLGQIDYAYDAIGNLVLKSTPGAGQPGHIAAPGAALGAMTYGGGSSSGRTGREPGDPPGPQALTGTASGLTFAYDLNGNVTRRGAAAIGWSLKDQLASYEHGGTRSTYVYDYSDLRVAKSVTTGGRRTDDTIYVNQYYEERPGRTPVKHVFSGPLRLARVEGSLDPTRDRVQRLRLAAGWNAVTAAVGAAKTLAQAFGSDAAFYTWRNGSYEVVPGSRQLEPGQALWVHAPAARLVVLKGPYAPPAGPAAVPPGGAFAAWPRLEAFVPEAHLSAPARLFVHDASARRWLLKDASLPSFLQDLGAALPSAGALWLDAPAGTEIRGTAREDQGILYYHLDHLGSSSVTTDEQGTLAEELAYFPFGDVRNRHSATTAGTADYDFTGKETDDESGFVYHGARHYDPVAGRFLSTDPLLGNPSELAAEKLDKVLVNPQKHGLYAYVLNNPLRYTDPDGLDSRENGPRNLMSKEEHITFWGGDRNNGMDPIKWRQDYTSIPLRGGRDQFIPYGTPVEKVSDDPRFRTVKASVQVVGPRGEKVKDHLFLVTFSGEGLHSFHTRQTNADGKIEFEAIVPRTGGQIRLEGFYDKGGKVLWAGGESSFLRKSGDNQLDFKVEIKEQVGKLSEGKTFEFGRTQVTEVK